MRQLNRILMRQGNSSTLNEIRIKDLPSTLFQIFDTYGNAPSEEALIGLSEGLTKFDILHLKLSRTGVKIHGEMNNDSSSNQIQNKRKVKRNTIKVLTQFEGFHYTYVPKKKKSRYQNKRLRIKSKQQIAQELLSKNSDKKEKEEREGMTLSIEIETKSGKSKKSSKSSKSDKSEISVEKSVERQQKSEKSEKEDQKQKKVVKKQKKTSGKKLAQVSNQFSKMVSFLEKGLDKQSMLDMLNKREEEIKKLNEFKQNYIKIKEAESTKPLTNDQKKFIDTCFELKQQYHLFKTFIGDNQDEISKYIQEKNLAPNYFGDNIKLFVKEQKPI